MYFLKQSGREAAAATCCQNPSMTSIYQVIKNSFVFITAQKHRFTTSFINLGETESYFECLAFLRLILHPSFMDFSSVVFVFSSCWQTETTDSIQRFTAEWICSVLVLSIAGRLNRSTTMVELILRTLELELILNILSLSPAAYLLHSLRCWHDFTSTSHHECITSNTPTVLPGFVFFFLYSRKWSKSLLVTSLDSIPSLTLTAIIKWNK